MKDGLVTLVVIMILKDTTTFQVLFVVSLFCAWNITTLEINSGVHLLKNNPPIVPLFTSGGLNLKNLVLFTSLPTAHCEKTIPFAIIVAATFVPWSDKIARRHEKSDTFK